MPNIIFTKDPFDHYLVSLPHKLLVMSFNENNFVLQVDLYYAAQWGLCNLIKIDYLIFDQIVIA
jgi:hypothetical protein